MTQLIRWKLSTWRSSVVIAALLSLCVSSNVGPQFLPLTAVVRGDESLHEQQGSTRVSRSPSDALAGFRVPMTQAQKRDPTPEHRPLAVLSAVNCDLSSALLVTAKTIDPKVYSSSASASPSPGRAPPFIQKQITS
jgi:hypothetical protein